MIAAVITVLLLIMLTAVGVTINDRVQRHHWRAVARERAAR